MIDPEEEKALLVSCSKGDRQAYALLYTRYVSPLCRYLFLFTRSKEDSEEIVQDVFVKIWEKKENLVTVQSFRPYVFKTAKNQLLDLIRRRETETKMLDYLRPVTEESSEYSDTYAIYNQYHQIAHEAKNLLPQKRKRIFEMKTEEGLSLDEIAESLSISKTVVKKQLYAATDFVREYLRKHAEMTTELVIFFYFFCSAK
ncbi:RNA polymerase sigma factor [Dyadobacter bucti]|uniref:RNA polymerase sigma factor n=1 Tax=Dyadobacter bucti TaxID=2572203 RepID=UPI00140D6A3D|nr:sigma-70 family RNA polymerase sigma factor [Dyadobacter bucti]